MSTSADNYISTSKGESSREGIVTHSINLKRDPKSFQTDNPISQDCLFCGKDFKKRSKEHFSSLVTKALYSKYSSSQNYDYTKDINEIMAEAKSSAVILFKDYIHFDEEEEYLKRFYQIHEYDFKIKMLTEYYKFHNEIARIFMLPVTHVVNRYHDKKRRLEYIRVTNMLKAEQGQEGPEGAEEEKKEHHDYVITDRILDDLHFTEPDSKDLKQNPYILQNDQVYFSRKLAAQEPIETSSKVSTAKNQQVSKTTDTKKNMTKNANMDVSVSSTLHDINMKLGEIISNSRSYHPESHYLENNESLPNETISNLDSFLVFLKKNPQDFKAIEIQKLIPKRIPAKNGASTSTADRAHRPESAKVAPKLKQTPKGETGVKISDSNVKNVSPIIKAPVRALKSHERSKDVSEERSMNPSIGNKHQDLDVRPSKPKSGAAPVTKIKNFEEAIKINTHDYQQKMSIHTSLPRETQEKMLPNTPKNRMSSSRTPNKNGKDKSYGSSKVRPQSSAATSTKSTMRSKTKSSDIYTKTLDLLLGSNQILLNSQVQKKEAAQTNNLKNSFNFKSKTPNQIQMHHQDKSIGGRDDARGDSALSSSNIKVMSSKVSADRISLQTDRGVSKKSSGLFGLDLPNKKDIRQGPLSDRQLSKDSVHRSKDFSGKSSTKKGLKVSILTQSESENMKPEFAPYFNKLGLHKYTKSESRIKKSVEKERKDSATKTSSITGNKKLKITHSPKKNASPSKYSNMAGVFPSSSTGKRTERSSALKTDRQPEQEGGATHRNDGSARNVKPRPTRSDLFSQFHQSLIKQLNGVNPNNEYRNFDLSPLRMSGKDGLLTRQTPSKGCYDFSNFGIVLTDRSPINFNTGYQYQTPNKKELDMIKKGLNLENFENLVNLRKNRKVNNFFK